MCFNSSAGLGQKARYGVVADTRRDRTKMDVFDEVHATELGKILIEEGFHRAKGSGLFHPVQGRAG